MNRGSATIALVVALVLAVAAGAGWWYVDRQNTNGTALKESSEARDTAIFETNTELSSQVSDPPSVSVASVRAEGPASISIVYANLPERTSALAVCVADGPCTEWVQEFDPPSASGTFTMSAQNAFGPTSQKGLAYGEYKIVVIGSEFSDRIAESDIFTVDQVVLISGAGAKLKIPGGWEYKVAPQDSGFDSYVLDEEGRLVMYINSPVQEKHRPIDTTYEKTTLASGVGTLQLYVEGYGSGGQALYVWSPEAKGDGRDWFNESFEIHVPFLAGKPFPLNAKQYDAGEGLPVRYKNYGEFAADRDTVENIIREIK